MIEKLKKYLSEVIAIAAMVIALVTAITSIVQTYDNKRHNRLSVRPLITLVKSSSAINEKDEYKFHITMSNSGVGPAFITDIKITINKEKVDTSKDFYTVFRKNLLGKLSKFNVDYSLLLSESSETVLKEGVETSILEVNLHSRENELSVSDRGELYKMYDEYTSFLSQIKVEVHYESLYEESFRQHSE